MAEASGRFDGGRQVLLHSAVISACDAALHVSGRRIVGTDGGHRLRLAETEGLLDGPHEVLFEDLDEARFARNEASYGAAAVLPSSVEEALAATEKLVELVKAKVERALPPYLRP